jgi:hypothetical protein
MDVSTVRRYVVRFSSDDSDVRDRPRTAVRPLYEESLDQVIRSDRLIMTRELCMELNVGFSALEIMLATLEYHKVCARWVSRMLAQEHKDHRMPVCQDLLDCPTPPTI